MIEKVKWQGTFIIKCINRDTGEVHEEVIENRIMDSAIDELIKPLKNEVPDSLEIKYLALGTDDSAVSDNQTQLGTEIARVQRTKLTETDTGEITTEFFVRYFEANDDIKELGIFVGDSAGEGANSGIMLSRILWNKTKNENMEFFITRIDRLVR